MANAEMHLPDSSDMIRLGSPVWVGDVASGEIPATCSHPSERHPNVPTDIHGAAFSLSTMFQIVTGCCIFFAVMKCSPMLAILGTIVATPAIIRTALTAELHQKSGVPFRWFKRSRCFLESTGLAVVTFAICAVVFAAISIAFGGLGVISSHVLGAQESIADIAFVGTMVGMVWGAAGAVVAFFLCARTWRIKI